MPILAPDRGQRVSATLGLLADWMRRDFRVRVSQTVLGSAWALVQPLALTAAFVFLFRGVAKLEAGVPYATFVYSGMLAWQLFSSGMQQATNAMANTMYIASKADYPRIVAPVSGALLVVVDLLTGLLLFPVVLVLDGAPFAFRPLPLLLGVLGCVTLTIGLGSLASALNIFVRDIRNLLPLVLQVALLLTPVAYPADRVPAALRGIAEWNPMTTYVAGFRSGLLDLPVPGAAGWLRAGAVTVALLALGLWYFHAVERRFADVA